MNSKNISVCVDTETANFYENLSEIDRKKLDILINLRLKEAVKKPRSLEDVIKDLTLKVNKRGLTLEELESILIEK